MDADWRTINLTQLCPGQIGRVSTVLGEPQLTLRIMELGLVCGTSIRLLRAAPLGGPIEVDVDGFLLSLRRNEAEAIRVETAGDNLPLLVLERGRGEGDASDKTVIPARSG